jgi:glycosyltransferase involved in cell wall biosynthesis
MNRRPRVTVVTPVHNQARYLAKALESVVSQTYDDWEAVVVDDASTDDSRAIAAWFAERYPARIRTIALDRNVGPAEARNRAIAASGDGELIALLDADDYWLDGYLERQVSSFDTALAAGGRPGVSACNALVQTPDGIEGRFDEVFFWTDRVTHDKMLERNYVMVSAMFPRAVFEQVGHFAPECWGTEDYDLWLRIIEAGYEVVVTPEPLVVYRDQPGGISKDLGGMADASIAVWTRALARNAMTPSQRRKAQRNLRHSRALKRIAAVAVAVRERAPFRAIALAIRAAPSAAVALVQSPSRWGEWSRILRGKRGPRPV